MPTFDPTIVPFLLRYPVDSSYDVPNASPLTANPALGLQLISTGGTFEVRPFGNLLSLATQHTNGILIAGPADSILSRTIVAGDASITIGNEDGVSGNPSIAVTPETTVQLVNLMANGVAFGTSTPTLNIQAGSNIGIGFDAGTNSWIINGASPGASTNDYIVVTQAASDLPNSFNLGGLTTGLLKQSVSGSVSTPATAIGNTDYMLVNQNMLDLYSSTPASGSLFYYNGTNWQPVAPGTTGYVWTALSPTTSGWSAGAGVVDTWSQYPALQNVNMAGFLINNLGTPLVGTDAATKAYADSIIGGAPVGAYYLITQSNVALTNATNLGIESTGLVLSTVSGSVSTVTTIPTSTFQPANLTATVTTTDATPTTLISIAIPSNEAITIDGLIIAKNSTHTAAVGGSFNATAINNAGTLTIMGTALPIVNASSTEIFNVIVSGTNLIVQVTGIAATTYTWNATYTTSTL